MRVYIGTQMEGKFDDDENLDELTLIVQNESGDSVSLQWMNLTAYHDGLIWLHLLKTGKLVLQRDR